MKAIICILALPLLSCFGHKEITIEPIVPIVSDKIEVVTETPVASTPNVEAEKEVVTIIRGNVNITITHHTPYCGGMAPSQDMLDRLVYPMSNTQYNLINLNTLEKTKVTTDSLGVLHLDLRIGNYAIQEMYKDCSFADFMKRANPQTGMYTKDMGEDCYKTWWKSYLGEFTVLSVDEYQELRMGESESCFTGNNPCLMYTGPRPP